MLVVLLSLLIMLTIYLPFSQQGWGLNAFYYTNAEWKGKPVITKIDKNCFLKGNVKENILSAAVFSVKWEGYIAIKKSGIYRFTTNSDDGSSLQINKKIIIDNGGAHGLRRVSAEVTLEKGMYPIEVLYFQIGGYNILEVLWTPPGGNEVFIPHELLFAKRPTWLGVQYREVILRLPQILTIAWIVFVIAVGSIFLMTSLKKVSLVYILQSAGLSIVSVIVFCGAAELVARIEYTPRKIDYNWIFEYDKDKIFRLKSNHIGEYGGVKITTNAYGYRDAEISLDKPTNTVRILALGDSITFGHGNVLPQELYTEVLEGQLNNVFSSHKTEVINTACPGNSARQEYYDLEKGLQFQPDVVMIQYTLNDVTEPYLVEKRHGGEGKDYHGVEDMPYYDYFLSQNSAFYLFLKDMISRVKFRSLTKEDLQKKALEREVFQVLDNLVVYHDHPEIKKAWNEYFTWLQKMSERCHQQKIPCILLISPYSFQLELDESFAYPQMILKKFSAEHGIFVVDLLALLQQDFKARMLKKYSLSETSSYKELVAEVKRRGEDDVNKFWYAYFIDADHYTIEGHRYVANILYETLAEHVFDNIYNNR